MPLDIDRLAESLMTRWLDRVPYAFSSSLCRNPRSSEGCIFIS